MLWLNTISTPISCFAAVVAREPANSLTASSWQYPVRKGLPPYFRTQAAGCTPQRGAMSVAVRANNPPSRKARKAESKYGTGDPKGSTSIKSNLLRGAAYRLKSRFASSFTTETCSANLLRSELSLASLAASGLISLITTFRTPLTSIANLTPLMPQPVRGSQTAISLPAVC